MSTNTKSSEKHLVTQSNKLIEADYSKAKLPAKTLKVGRLIVAKISPDDKDFRLTRVKNSDIRQYLGYKKNVPYNRFNADLENICKQLNEEPIRLLTDKGTILNAFLISSWENDWREDVTVFEISGRLKEHLLELQRNYTTYQLKNLPSLKSSYSIRIYEILIQYKKIGKRTFELEDLKRLIGCNYNLYGHVKKKAILKAQSELIKHTDIRFDFEEIKEGKKVIGLIFYIYPNEPKSEESKQGVLDFLTDSIEIKEKPNLSDTITQKLTKIGISIENIDNLQKQGFDLIQNESSRKEAITRCKTIEIYYLEKITLLDQSKTAGSNPAGFLIKALREDWKTPKVFQEQKKREIAKQRKDRHLQIVKLEKQREIINQQYRKLREPILIKLVNNEAAFMEAYQVIEKKEQGSSFRTLKKNLSPHENYHQSPIVSSQINIQLEANYPELFAEVRELYQKQKQLDTEIKKLEKHR